MDAIINILSDLVAPGRGGRRLQPQGAENLTFSIFNVSESKCSYLEFLTLNTSLQDSWQEAEENILSFKFNGQGQALTALIFKIGYH